MPFVRNCTESLCSIGIVRVPVSQGSCCHVIGVRLLRQSASEKHNQEKGSPQTFAQLVNFFKMCLPYLRIIQSCYFDYRINKPFTCPRCVICVSRSVHMKSTYYVPKGSWAFHLNYPHINVVEKSNHKAVMREAILKRFSQLKVKSNFTTKSSEFCRK